MKLKYYLRGLGIGIIATTIILMIAYSQQKTELTDAEIIQRAEALGMIMQEDNDPLFSHNSEKQDTEQKETENTEVRDTEVVSTESETVSEDDTELVTETESKSEVEIETETYHLVITSGMMPRLICNELEENGVIESAAELRQYLVDVGYATSIKVGEYDIPYGASNEEIYQILKSGSN